MPEPANEEKRLFTIRDRDFAEYAAEFGFKGGRLLREIDKLAKNSLVVDIGSGEGKFILDFKKLQEEGKIDKSVKILGIDWYSKQDGEENLVKGNIERIPLSSGQVDLAFSVCALGFYAKDEEDLGKQFKELSRILSDSGRALLVLWPTRMGNVSTNFFIAEDPKDGMVFEKRGEDGNTIEYYLGQKLDEVGLEITGRRGSLSGSGHVGIFLKKK